MADHKVDSFIVELGFNENVIKGLQRVEKAAMQSATRIEKNLNRAFRINTKEIDKNLSSSLNNVEKKLNRTFSRLEKRTRQSKAFQFTTSVNERVRRRRAAEELMSDRAVRAAYQANMSRLKGINPFMHKYVKSQFYGLSKEAGSVDPSKFNEKLAQLNANVRESLAKAKSKLKTPPALEGVNKASFALSGLSSAALAAGAAFVSFEAVLDSYRKVMEVGLKRAASERATEFVFGSNAQQVKDYTVSLSKQTGMDVSELQSQFAGFGASSQNTLGLENSEKLFKEMVVYGRSMGRSDDEIHRALVAIEQMASKGQIMSEELKGQLGEAMPGIIQEFVKALGLKSEKQLLDLMKKGLTADSTLLKVMGQLDKTIKEKGGYEVVSNSTQTQLGNLKSEWNNYLNDIFKGSEQGLRDFAKSLTNFLESLGGSGKTLGEELGSLFDGMAEGIDTLTTISYRVQGFVDEMQLAYRSLDDATKGWIDELVKLVLEGPGAYLGNLAGDKIIKATNGLKGLSDVIDTLGDVVTRALSLIFPELKLLKVIYDKSAGGKDVLPQHGLNLSSNLNPDFNQDPDKPNQLNAGWAKVGSNFANLFENAAYSVANLQAPSNRLVNHTPTLSDSNRVMVENNAQLAIAVTELSSKVEALTVETKKPVAVNITGEAVIKPDEPSFMTFNKASHDEFTADMLLTSGYPEE